MTKSILSKHKTENEYSEALSESTSNVLYKKFIRQFPDLSSELIANSFVKNKKPILLKAVASLSSSQVKELVDSCHNKGTENMGIVVANFLSFGLIEKATKFALEKLLDVDLSALTKQQEKEITRVLAYFTLLT